MKHLFLSVSPLTESTIQDLSNVAPTRALTKNLEVARQMLCILMPIDFENIFCLDLEDRSFGQYISLKFVKFV